MKLKINRTLLLERIEAHLAAARAVHSDAASRYTTETLTLAIAMREELTNFIDALSERPFDTIEAARFGIEPVSVRIFGFSGNPPEVVLTRLRVPAVPEPIDPFLERDRELVASCVDLTISLGPEDHLYRYLANPEAR